MKDLDLSRSVFDLTNDYPELIEVLADLGFSEITKPAMRSSLGRLTTIPRGAVMKGLDMTDVIVGLTQAGFSPKGEPPKFVQKMLKKDEPAETAAETEAQTQEEAPTQDRVEQIKGYLRRLGKGEDLEVVRAEFVEEFQEVDAQEIMDAEQALMKEGTPLEEVQRLCDVHSALFHETTCSDNSTALANAEEAVARMFAERTEQEDPFLTPGHPLYTFHKENEALQTILTQAKEALDGAEDGEEAYGFVAKARQVAIHYAKKGDLLYPPLKVTYDIDGPSQVMWTVDDEIRDEFKRLCSAAELDQAWMMAAQKVLTRAEEMIYKEENILFPLCVKHFSRDEWIGIYRDSLDYSDCFGVVHERWEAAIEELSKEQVSPASADDEVVLAGGRLRLDQLEALLNTLPIEVTFIDDQHINRYFNEGPKVFKRPLAALGREVFSCHPPKIEPMVRGILDDFKEGKRDSVPIWMEKEGKPYLVTYCAIRSKQGQYLGCAEFVQDMADAQDHFARVFKK